MAHIATINVDTHPMAHSIDSVNGSVLGVGAAVTAMQAAVVASEQKAAEQICTGINTGFYMLLRSRMSQRVSEFASAMKSRVILMMDTGRAIDKTHDNMQSDFARIKAQYSKIFQKIDENTERMVRELDAPAMNLSRLRLSLLEGRACRDASPIVFFQSETAQLSYKAANALLKSHSYGSISKLSKGAGLIRDYERTIDDVLEYHAANGTLSEGQELVPVIYSVSEGLDEGRTLSMKVDVPEAVSDGAQAEIARGVRRSQGSLKDTNPHDMRAVYSAYVDMVHDAPVDPRVRQSMLSLFNESFDVSNKAGDQS